MKPQEELALLGKQLNNALALLERIHEDYDTADQELFHIWHALRLECAAAWERHSAVLKGEERALRTVEEADSPSLLPTPPKGARREAVQPRRKLSNVRALEEVHRARSEHGGERGEPETPEPEELSTDEAAAEGLETVPVLRKKPRLKKAERDLAGNPIFDAELSEVFDKGLDSAATELLNDLQKK